jgi:hypothetical protein
VLHERKRNTAENASEAVAAIQCKFVLLVGLKPLQEVTERKNDARLNRQMT